MKIVFLSISRQPWIALLSCLLFYFSSFTCFARITVNALKETSTETGIKNQPQIDFTQADLMLKFLQGLAEHNQNLKEIDLVLGAKGTDLIIKQMNLARKVTRDQYRQILTSLAKGTLPQLEPADSSERAKRGLEGLEKDVWPALRWAIEHTDILEERIDAVRGMDLYNEAQTLALKNLPEPVDMSPSLFVVMGGRAGFAAVEGDNIYFDLLVMTYSRISRDRPYITNEELLEFFAHEMHHIGLARIIEQRRLSLELNDNQSRVFRFLSSLVEEGSATYLINEHRDLDRMRDDPSYSDYLEKTDELLGTCENVLRSLIAGDVKDEEDYDRVTSPMLGNAYHSAGSIMLSVINRVQGFDSIMEILTDPRLLLIRYNEAAGVLQQDSLSIYIFNLKLAEEVSALGH